MNKLSFKIGVTIFVILCAWVFIQFILPKDKTKEDGTITLQIYNASDELLYQGTHDFEKGMYLYDVLDQSFDIICGNQSYQQDPTCSYTFTGFAYQGKVVLGISNQDFSIITNWSNTFLAIEYQVNDSFVLAQKGPSHLTLKDQDIIRISVRSVSS